MNERVFHAIPVVTKTPMRSRRSNVHVKHIHMFLVRVHDGDIGSWGECHLDTVGVGGEAPSG